MAQQATPYKVHLNLTDTDRGVYESLRMTVARHPSETGQRMISRVLAYALWYQERLAFGRGLSDVDEPALWHKSLDGRIEHWIEVGQPDADRLIWCSRRAERVSLLAYGNTRVWASRVLPAVAGLKNLNIAALPQEPLDALAEALPRSIDWGLMITDGVLYVSDADVQQELPLEWLMGER
ncbi:YaeQ family protein [Halopseudomonas pelagia]|uniref:YaeQ family protein n=1 Tax=Halopseudomonas pelagia TaxID=553151 RepID=UPI00039B2F4C|nr:YaeQ family protein [Halopseudomonas pelagia]|tara:strand:+ start:1266 stop:1805 length:540 start_codon:yes stop_codon:yes gene_type:complete